MWIAGIATHLASAGENRLAYLHTIDPYYVSRDFARLATPQWVGEPGVDAVVVLAIDDMRDHERYEAFLRPIIDRLKQLDGRGALSIMTIRVDPREPHLQKWLAEGVSLEVHTFDHPCPLLKDDNFDKARRTYDRCVDQMTNVPNNQPVAFRMPCCDSLNTLSPRFFAEIFNRTTPAGNYLAIDSSVFVVLTSNDPSLPRELVQEPDGRERFRKYLPFPSFVNTIEDYPYPYPIGSLCWEFPCIVPSDWEAQNLQKPNNPKTVDDLIAALDAVVIKQGVFDLVFHPHGWIRNDQIVQFIDRAVQKHGSKVKFLSFRDALDRINHNLLVGQPLRADDGGDNGVRLIDLDGDGFQDVVIGNRHLRRTRVWRAAESTWHETTFPVPLVHEGPPESRDAGARFGILRDDGHVSLLVLNEQTRKGWHFDGEQWVEAPRLIEGLSIDDQPVVASQNGVDRGVRLIDLNADGRDELIVAGPEQRAVFRYDPQSGWHRLDFALPEEIELVDDQGHDRGLRFIDIDDDRQPDLLFSNEQRYALYLFDDLQQGWNTKVISETRRQGNRIPMIARGTTNNGAWFHSRHLWVQNENTARLPDLVDRRSFNDLLAGSRPRGRSPQASLKALRARDGFQVELVASEPLLADPVDFDWGTDGRLWVVEMGDYPEGLDGAGQPGGRVRFLEDTNHDGRYDRSTIFLDGLHYPTAVMAWRRGALVIAAPDIFYAEDTDGDGRADRRDVLFTGLSRGNPQHISNGLVRGLDGWIYCAAASNQGKLRSLKTGQIVDIRGRDYRIQPDTGRAEPLLGKTQFIRSRDSWDDWFGNHNTNPMFQFLLEDRYLARNPHLPAPSAVVDVSQRPGSAPVFPRSRTVERFNDLHTANRFTSACSSILYRDTLFGPAFSHSTFVSEPVHNLVHREVWWRDGIEYHSRRALDEQKSEFLASTDNWFRPTRLRTGPDGALWIADMYRAVIEHPEWIPPSMQAQLDLRAGAGQGRLYRVFPVGSSPRPIENYEQMPTPALVAALENPSGTARDLIQQTLLERRDPKAVGPLRQLAVRSSHATARLHAMYVLAGLNQLDIDTLRSCLRDQHPGVRRHAIRLSEPRLANHPELAESMLLLINDNDATVRRQLAYSLGEWDDPRAGQALAELLIRNGHDRWITAAAFSSVTRRLSDVVDALVASSPVRFPDHTKSASSQPPQQGSDSQRQQVTRNELTALPAETIAKLMIVSTAVNEEQALTRLIKVLALDADPGEEPHATLVWRFSILAQWLDALARKRQSFETLRAKASDELRAELEKLALLFNIAQDIAADAAASETLRVWAIRLLGRLGSDSQQPIEPLLALLAANQPPAVQREALRTLGRLPAKQTATRLFDSWAKYGPGIRSALLDLALQRPDWARACLAALAAGRLSPADIDAARRQQLLTHRDTGIRAQANKLLASDASSDRQQVIEQLRHAVERTADAKRGREVFNKRCAVCHRFGGEGYAIGPDLSALTDKSDEALLIAILDPNRAVETKYLGYTATTVDGRIYTGLLAAETSNSITLLAQEGKQHTLLRSEIDVLASSGKSLMPEGLEKDLSAQDLADVMEYLRVGAPHPKKLKGNQPQLVTADPLRHELFCLPSNAEIYGDTLTIDPFDGALSSWQSENDHVVWNIEAPHEAEYLVFLEWSTDSSTPTNSYVLEVGSSRLTRNVEPTKGPQQYRRSVIGRVRLHPGTYRVGLRSDGRIEGNLFRVKSVTLRPILKNRP